MSKRVKIEVVVRNDPAIIRGITAAITAVVGKDHPVVESFLQDPEDEIGEPSLREFTEEIKEGLRRREVGDLANGNHD